MVARAAAATSRGFRRPFWARLHRPATAGIEYAQYGVSMFTASLDADGGAGDGSSPQLTSPASSPRSGTDYDHLYLADVRAYPPSHPLL